MTAMLIPEPFLLIQEAQVSRADLGADPQLLPVENTTGFV